MDIGRLRSGFILGAIALLAVGCSEGEIDPIETEDHPELIIADSVAMSAEVGEATQQGLTVANNGDEDLDVEFHLDAEADWFGLDVESLQLEPEEAYEITLQATCPQTEESATYNTDLMVTSNDPELGETTVDVELTCDGEEVEPGDPSAMLTVNVEGLPDGLDADISVAGPDGFSADLTATGSLDELVAGDYTVTAAPVEDGADQYAPVDSSIAVSLGEDASETVTVEYELATEPGDGFGDLHVDVVGLPGGVDHDINVEGEGESYALPQDGMLEDLPAGAYTVTPEDVEDGDDLYRASSEDVTVPEDGVGEATVEYELVPEEVEEGDLHVTVTGLPSGVDHDINVEGEGESYELPQDGILTDLPAGSYTVTPEDVDDGPAVYEAAPVDVTVVGDETATATVEYIHDEPPADGGALSVDVSGLDDGVDHEIVLVDADGNETDVPQDGQMDGLTAGDYTLEVDDAEEGLATYEPRESSITINVTIVDDETTEVDVVYELVEASWEVEVNGLPDGVDADVDVAGGDLDTMITETTSWNDLRPDSYDITPNSVSSGVSSYEASSQSVDVASGNNDAATVTYEVVTGTLNVIVSGLDNVDADIEVRDESGTTVATLDGSEIITDLAPGSYTVDPQPVDDGGTTYTAGAQTRDVLSNATTDVQITYQDVPGELELTASGLPAGAELSATVEGPSDYSSDNTGAQTVSGLESGDYTVTFKDVEVDAWTTYAPDPAEVTVTVTADDTPEASTTYARVDGELEVTASDVPDGSDFEATVTGPDGFSEDVTGDESFADLTPGEYTINYASIDTDQWTTYEPSPQEVTVDVESGTAPVATTEYGLIDSGLGLSASGLPGDLQLEATVEGPDGYSEDFTGGQSIGDLTPGEYTVTFKDVDDGPTLYEPEPEEVVVDVNSGEAPSVSTQYSSVDGAIAVSASGLPDGVDLEASVSGPDGYAETVTGEETLDGLDAGEYTVTFNEVSDGALTSYEPNPEERVIELESGDTAGASTSYEVIYGGIALDADGLSGGPSLEASISGPDGYSESFTGAQTVGDLIPGEYTVTFESVDDGGVTYSAEPNQVVVDVESGGTVDAETTYEAIDGGLEVTVNFPADVEEFTLEIVDDEDNVVADAQATNGFVGVFDDLDAVPHTVQLNGEILDEWLNEYTELQGFDEPHQVNSGEIAPVTLSGIKPTLVQHDGDDGAASLRDVVASVNAESIITFDDDIDTIGLQSQIDVEESLTIMGDDNRHPVIEATGNHRAFYFHGTADDVTIPTLQSLTISGGDADGHGGAVYAASDLTLFDVTLEGNSATGDGGAVYADRELTLFGTRVHNNTADGSGGGVRVNDTLFAEDVEFSDNVTDSGISWGGAIYLAEGSAYITQAVFRNNHAASSGGAIMGHLSSDSLFIERSLFADNTASSGGGAIRVGSDTTLENTTFYGNHTDGLGGALRIQWDNISVDMTHVTMVDNSADSGPAIYWDGNNDSQVSLGQSLIAENGTDQSELFVSRSDAEIATDFDNVITALDDGHFADSSTWDVVGTVADPLDAHIKHFGYQGGQPQTVSVTEDSPAYEHVFSFDCHAEDQRGYARPSDQDCTAGAWEPDPNLEDFDLLDGLGNSYTDGSFTGNDGIEWYYEDAKNASASSQDNEIDGHGIILRGDDGAVGADNISGGIDALQVQYRKAYTSNTPRQFEVLIDGDVVGTSPEFGATSEADPTVYTLTIDDIDVTGDFDVEIRHLIAGTGSQMTIDNIRWE